MKRGYRLEVKPGKDELWYFHLRAPNGRIVMDGAEGYATEANARRALLRLVVVFDSHRVEIPAK